MRKHRGRQMLQEAAGHGLHLELVFVKALNGEQIDWSMKQSSYKILEIFRTIPS